MNEFLLNSNRDHENHFSLPSRPVLHQAPKAEERLDLVQRFRDRNENRRRRENLFGCVMH